MLTHAAWVPFPSAGFTPASAGNDTLLIFYECGLRPARSLDHKLQQRQHAAGNSTRWRLADAPRAETFIKSLRVGIGLDKKTLCAFAGR